jgi:hypothetical protein
MNKYNDPEEEQLGINRCNENPAYSSYIPSDREYSIDPKNKDDQIVETKNHTNNKNKNQGNINIIGSMSFEKFIKKSHSLGTLIAERNLERNIIGTKSKVNKAKNKNLPNKKEGKNFKNINSKNKTKSEKNLHIGGKKEIKNIYIKNFEKRKNSHSNLDNNSVFNRLTDNHQFLKKEKEIKLMDDLYNKHPCSFEPEINKISKLQNRNVNDLYNWMNMKKEKRIRLENEMNKNCPTKILPYSEEILKDLNPLYLEKKVEDRLIEKGNV